MRLSVTILANLLVIATSVSANADGICGQSPAYAAGYAPSGYVTYGTGVAPNSIAGPSYVAGYAPPALTYVDPSAVAPLSSNGTYQAQRPAYFDNPSVYTGAPTYPGVQAAGYQAAYQSFSAPITGTLRGNAPPTAFVETYPSTYASAYDGSIPGQPMTMTTPMGAPATAIPVTQVAPIYAPAPQSKGCCLSRCFSKLFGTSYSTSYYRAPITYYRPVTSADALTGAPVVVQQPCDSYVQQMQRTPYNTLQFGQQPAVTGPSSCPTACPTNQPSCGPSPYDCGATTINSPNNYGQFGAVGQVGAVGGMGTVTNIPSTAPISPQTMQPSFSPTQPGMVPNTAPLTGTPTIAPPSGNGDLAPVGQPSLNSGSIPALPQNQTIQPPSQSSPTHWQLQNPEDSTALIRPKSSEPRGDTTGSAPATTTQQILENENFTSAEPIEAPADYVVPYRRHTYQAPRTMPVNVQDYGTAGQPHSNRTYDASDLTSVSTRMPSMASSSSTKLPTRPAAINARLRGET